MGRQSDELKDYYTVEELAGLLRVTDKVIHNMARAGELAHYMVGRVMRFRREDVEALLSSMKMVVQQGAAKQPVKCMKPIKPLIIGLGCIVAAAAWKWKKRG